MATRNRGEAHTAGREPGLVHTRTCRNPAQFSIRYRSGDAGMAEEGVGSPRLPGRPSGWSPSMQILHAPDLALCDREVALIPGQPRLDVEPDNSVALDAGQSSSATARAADDEPEPQRPLDAAATEILKAERLDFALLDVQIGIQTSLEFALSMRDAGIPYVFATGYGENVDLGTSHRAPAVISKPFERFIASSIIATALVTNKAARSML